VTKHWTTLIVGFWILVSPWLLGFADISVMKWSNVACGAIIILADAWQIFGERSVEVQVKGEKEKANKG
jgi:hypothetical protein